MAIESLKSFTQAPAFNMHDKTFPSPKRHESQTFTRLWHYNLHWNTRTLGWNKTPEDDNATRLLDNAALVSAHAMGRFSKDPSEVGGLRSRGPQLQVEWMATALYAESWKEV